MNKTLQSVASMSLLPQPQMARLHSCNTLKISTKESNNAADKSGRSRSSRDVLTNITNNKDNNNNNNNNNNNKDNNLTKKTSQGGGVTKLSKREKSKSSKISKRSAAAVLVDITETTSGTVAGVIALEAAKRRKSDPMVIDLDSDDGMALVQAAVAALAPPLPPTPASVVVVPEWEDIDVNDSDDPQAITEYVNDIYDNLMEMEKKDRINPAYLPTQHEINEKMRSILVDWLIEVHRMFKLLPETLFLSIHIIDRYLSQRSVSRDKLQLVGITSMLVASKYEEIFAPECNDFVYISDGAYTKEQILTTEQTILNVLAFDLTHPSPLHFLRRYSKAAGSDYTIHTLCKYIIEVMLIDVKMLKYTASQLAAGAVLIARAMSGKTPLWTITLEHYSTYGEAAVKVVALEMNDLLKKNKNSSLKALKKKYSTPKYGQVADIALVDL